MGVVDRRVCSKGLASGGRSPQVRKKSGASWLQWRGRVKSVWSYSPPVKNPGGWELQAWPGRTTGQHAGKPPLRRELCSGASGWPPGARPPAKGSQTFLGGEQGPARTRLICQSEPGSPSRRVSRLPLLASLVTSFFTYCILESARVFPTTKVEGTTPRALHDPQPFETCISLGFALL